MTMPASVLAPPPTRLIPEAAADRDAIFFFGTLMHEQVLSAVLDRPMLPSAMTAATLAGFRRERAMAASYPVLVADPSSTIEGRLLSRPTLRDIRRINHFDDDEYEARQVIVETSNGVRLAWVFMVLDGVAMMRPSGEPWALEPWVRHHIDGYLEAVQGWMANAPE